MKILFFLLPAILSSCHNFSNSCVNECNVDTSRLSGYDYRLFCKAGGWDLAQAVRDNDTSTIKKIISKKRELLNLQEPKFGITLLMLSVRNRNYNSTKKMLELGASPNLHDHSNGGSAMIDSARPYDENDDGIEYLKLMLKYGGIRMTKKSDRE